MWANLGDILTDAGDAAAAHDAYSRARELATIELGVNPNDPAILMDAAWVDAMLGDEAAARSGIARAKAMAPDDPYASYYEGLIFTRYGDTEAALDSLEQAIANGYSVKILAAEPLLESLHDHARFVALTNTN